MQLQQVRAWSILEMLAQRQDRPARWDKTETGYHLARAADSTPWTISAIALAIVLPLLGLLALGNSRRTPQGATGAAGRLAPRAGQLQAPANNRQ